MSAYYLRFNIRKNSGKPIMDVAIRSKFITQFPIYTCSNVYARGCVELQHTLILLPSHHFMIFHDYTFMNIHMN